MNALKIIPFVPNDPLDTPRFRKCWEEWKEERMGYRKPKVGWDRFFKRQYDWLAEYGEEAAYQAVQFSLNNGYQGLFPERFTGQATSRVVTTSAYHQLVNTEKLLEAKLKMNPGLPTKCLVSQAEWDSAMELQDKWKAEVKELRESIYALRERMRETL
jgi:hypothetical protein